MKRDTGKSLTKALDILEIFVKTKKEMTLSEISKSLDLNNSTVNRIMTTLVKRGYIYQKEKRGKYFLGSIYLSFYGVVKSKIQIREIAAPYLIELSHQVNESVVLSLLHGGGQMMLETFRDVSCADHTLKAVPNESSTFLLHSNALGKIMLASYTDEELKRYFDTHKIVGRTPNTITTYRDMKKHLEMVREEGIAFDYEEESVGVRSVAAGLKDGEGKTIGAINVIAPSIRLPREDMRKLALVVKKYADNISNQLGYLG
jgi:IclR family transcriptional regulator, KDG regulon repressor